MGRGVRAAQSERLKIIRIIVDAIRCHCLNPSRSQCATIAKDAVALYPKTFGDVTDEGDLLGCGYTSLLNQFKTRVEHLNRNNTLAKVRQPKRKKTETAFPRNGFKMLDSYGCVNWQPKVPEGETPNSLEVKRQMLTTLFNREGPRQADTSRVDELMSSTYWNQREFINSSPPPQVSAIKEEWPFLFETRWLCSHFETLTGIDILTRLSEALDGKGRRIVNFFFQQRLTWKGEVTSLLRELEDDNRTLEDANFFAVAAILLVMAFFKEESSSLFILADGTATVVDIEELGLPDTPRLIMLGEFLLYTVLILFT
ncbi:uncharacterized protein LOC142369998 [Odontesthes bonariensis]|uniref:uncharacterized protein LOC142369998 n=1 Tax=Odontesthes bonariensis TaxID=219752 RepID=UPI003F58CF3A